MILTHGTNSLPRGANDPDVIGGRKYRTVTIGEQTWLAENLDFQFPGLVVGASGTSYDEPRGNYYKNNESAYGVNGNKYGLLYNWIAVKHLEDNKSSLIPGWHVPTYIEWGKLIAAVGGTSASKKLKSTMGWSSGAGTDDYGFSAFPAGFYNSNFYDLGEYAYFWTASLSDYNIAQQVYFSTNNTITQNNGSVHRQYSVRLVKDA